MLLLLGLDTISNVCLWIPSLRLRCMCNHEVQRPSSDDNICVLGSRSIALHHICCITISFAKPDTETLCGDAVIFISR